MDLGSWIKDLAKRVEYFATWIKTNQQPVSFWLGAFTFPTGFLTSVLQVGMVFMFSIELFIKMYLILQSESKKSSVQIATLNWDLIPISTSLNDLVLPPNVQFYFI